MTHDELREVIPGLALDALMPAEESEVRAHVEQCIECRSALDIHLDTAAMLALAADPKKPSPALKDRILSEANKTAQVVSIDSKSPVRPSTVASARSRRMTAALASVALLVSVAFSGWLALRFRSQNQIASEQKQALAVASSPTVKTVEMSAASRSNAKGRIFIPEQGKDAAVVMTGLGDPGSHIYTLWLTSEGANPIPLKSFAPDQQGLAIVYLGRTVAPQGSMAVTLESSPGHKSPQGPTILSS